MNPTFYRVTLFLRPLVAPRSKLLPLGPKVWVAGAMESENAQNEKAAADFSAAATACLKSKQADQSGKKARKTRKRTCKRGSLLEVSDRFLQVKLTM